MASASDADLQIKPEGWFDRLAKNIGIAREFQTGDRKFDDALYLRLGEVSRTIADAASAALSDAGVPHRIQWAGSMFSVYFRDGAVRTYDDARDQDTAAFGRFFHAMLDRGVYLAPAAFEAGFVSAMHTDAVIDETIVAARAAFAKLNS